MPETILTDREIVIYSILFVTIALCIGFLIDGFVTFIEEVIDEFKTCIKGTKK